MCTHSLHSDRYIDCFGIGYQIKEMKKKVVYLWRSGSPAHAAGHDKSSQPVNSITRASDPPDLVFGFFPLPDGMDPPPRSVDAASHRTDLIFFCFASNNRNSPRLSDGFCMGRLLFDYSCITFLFCFLFGLNVIHKIRLFERVFCFIVRKKN